MNIERINFYGLKGGAGVKMETATLDQHGLCNKADELYQRCFVVYRIAENGTTQVITQRPRQGTIQGYPKIARTQLHPVNNKKVLILMPEFRVLALTASFDGLDIDSEPFLLSIWDRFAVAYDMGEKASEAISLYLQEENLGIAYIPASNDVRGHKVMNRFRGKKGFSLVGQDGSQVSLLLKETVEKVFADKTIDASFMNRFRSEIILQGGEPFEEESLVGREFMLGGARLLGRKIMPRCEVPTINQRTGVQDMPEITRTLAKRPGDLKRCLALGAQVLQGGHIRRGDTIKIIA